MPGLALVREPPASQCGKRPGRRPRQGSAARFAAYAGFPGVLWLLCMNA